MLNQAKVLRSLLSNDATITSLVGDRVRTGKLDQDEGFPAIVMHQISGRDNASKSGPNDADVCRWQINVYADNLTDLADISDQIRSVIDGYGNQTVESVEVDGIKYLSEILMIQDEHDLYHFAVDYQVRTKT